MKNLKLKVVSRLVLVSLVNEHGSQGASLSEMNKMMKLIDKLSFKEEEIKKFSLRLENVKQGDKETAQWKWNALAEDGSNQDVEVEIELSEEQVKIIEDIFKKKNDDKKIDFSNFAIVKDVSEQLELKLLE